MDTTSTTRRASSPPGDLHAFPHPYIDRRRLRPRPGGQRPHTRPRRRSRPGQHLLPVLPAAARPVLHAGCVQLRRHAVHHQQHDLRVRLDRAPSARPRPTPTRSRRRASSTTATPTPTWPTTRRTTWSPSNSAARRAIPATCGPSPLGTKTSHTKDGTETKLKNAVCKGTITLSAARTAIKDELDHGAPGHRHRLSRTGRGASVRGRRPPDGCVPPSPYGVAHGAPPNRQQPGEPGPLTRRSRRGSRTPVRTTSLHVMVT